MTYVADVGETVGIQIRMARAARPEHDLQTRVLREKLDHVEHRLGHEGRVGISVGRVGQVDVRIVHVAVRVERDEPARFRIKQHQEGRQGVWPIVRSARRAGAVGIKEDFDVGDIAAKRVVQNRYRLILRVRPAAARRGSAAGRPHCPA